MGSSNSKSLIGKINQNQWTNIKYEGDAQIVRSNNGQGEGQIRMISLDPKHSIEKQQSIYGYRRDTDMPLVKCYGVDFSKSQQSTMCGNQKNVRVLTQRIPTNIQQIRTLTFPQSLYVLSQSLAGFDDLHRNTGVFDISGKMIGFNKNGETKVWLNQNYAQNHPATQRPILQTTMTHVEPYSTAITGEQRMVETVLGLVQNKCQQGKFPMDFDTALLNKHSTFNEAYNCVKSYILNHQNLPIPSRINFQNKTEWFQNKIDKFIDEPKVVVRDQQSKVVNYSSNINQNRFQNQYRSKQKPVTITYNNTNQSYYRSQSPRIVSRVIRPSQVTFAIPQPQPVQTRQFVTQSYVQQPYRFGAVSGVKPVNRSPQISINYSSPVNYYNPQVRHY